MKELLATGVTVVALSFFGSTPVGPVCELDCPAPILQMESEGFLPRERITRPPIQSTVSDDLLPDFGSQAYL